MKLEKLYITGMEREYVELYERAGRLIVGWVCLGMCAVVAFMFTALVRAYFGSGTVLISALQVIILITSFAVFLVSLWGFLRMREVRERFEKQMGW